MKNEKEIKEAIEKTTESNKHVLDVGPSTIEINAVRAIMQIAAIHKLEALYWVLGEKMPNFTCLDRSKTDQ